MGLLRKLSMAVIVIVSALRSQGHAIHEDVWLSVAQTTPHRISVIHQDFPFLKGEDLVDWFLRHKQLIEDAVGGGGPLDWNSAYVIIGAQPLARAQDNLTEFNKLKNVLAQEIRDALHEDPDHPRPIVDTLRELDGRIGGQQWNTLSCLIRFQDEFSGTLYPDLLTALEKIQNEVGSTGVFCLRLRACKDLVSPRADQSLLESLEGLSVRWGGQGSLAEQTNELSSKLETNSLSPLCPLLDREISRINEQAITLHDATSGVKKMTGDPVPTNSIRKSIRHVVWLLDSDFPVQSGDLPDTISLMQEVADLGQGLSGQNNFLHPRQAVRTLLQLIGNPSSANALDDLQPLIPILSIDAQSVWDAMEAIDQAVGERGEKGDIESGIYKQIQRIDESALSLSNGIDSVQEDIGAPVTTLKKGTQFLLIMVGRDPQESLERSLNWSLQRGVELTRKGAPGWLPAVFDLHALVGGDPNEDLYTKLSRALTQIKAFLPQVEQKMGKSRRRSGWFGYESSPQDLDECLKRFVELFSEQQNGKGGTQ